MQTNIAAASVSGRGILTVSGIPPLTFTAQNTEVLKNYRIYGNTVNGASVGDKTANLCDEIYIPGNVLGSSSQRLKIEHTIPVTAGTAYTLSFVSSDFQLYIDSSPTAGYPFSGSSLTYCGNPSGWQDSTCTFTATNNGYIAITIRKKNNAVISADDIDFPVMFQVGAQASAYEPYGYRIPVTLNDLTAIIYLSEPLGKTGNNADYLDFTAQKRYNADGTSGDILLPPLTISAGTNTFSIGTAVQPSSVEIKEIIRNITQTMTAMIRPMQRLTGKIKAASSGYSRGDHYIVPVGEYQAVNMVTKTVQSAGYQPEATEEGFTI